MKKFYVGVAPCCGSYTAALVDDDKTTAGEIADFSKRMAQTGRDVRHVEVDLSLPMKSCDCRRAAASETTTHD